MEMEGDVDLVSGSTRIIRLRSGSELYAATWAQVSCCWIRSAWRGRSGSGGGDKVPPRADVPVDHGVRPQEPLCPLRGRRTFGALPA